MKHSTAFSRNLLVAFILIFPVTVPATVGQVQKVISNLQSQKATENNSTSKAGTPVDPNQTTSNANVSPEIIETDTSQSPLSDQDQIIQTIETINSINKQLLQIENNDALVQALLDKKTAQLSELMILLRSTTIDTLPRPVSNERLNFINSRIAINQERGNNLAVMRDQIQRQYYLTLLNFRQFVLDLISAAKNYQSKSIVEDIAQKALAANKKQQLIFDVPKVENESQVYKDLQANYAQLLVSNTTYQDVLNYVINNPGLIASTHWFQFVTLNSSITFFNSLEFAKPINRRLAPLKLDFGGILTSILIYFLIYFSFPFIFQCIHWLVEKFLLDDDYGKEEIIYEELQRPILCYLIFIGIDMGTYALLYKTDFRPSLEAISFIVYTFFNLWLIFKALDCYVLIKIRNTKKTNKELRKELFNLGVKVTKGILILIAIAVVLNKFGISITAIMSTLGIGGLAFALAAKDSLSNLFGGVTVLLDNVFKMGDWVKIDDMEGTVADIGLRSTTIRTFDNALVTIPNSVISVSSVINWNRRALGRRIKMYVGVTYESNMEDIRSALDDLRTMLQEHPGIANPKQKIGSYKRQFRFSSHEDTQGIKSTQLVYMDRYNDYSIDILIYCFSRTVNWAEWLEVKEDVMFKIAEILKKNNLEFAYPTQVRIFKDENPSLIPSTIPSDY